MEGITKVIMLLCILLMSGTGQTLSSDLINKLPDGIPRPLSNADIDSENRSPLLVSVDHGKTWKKPEHNIPNGVQVSFLERMGDEIVMATDNSGIYISTQRRTKWQQIGNGLPSKKINALHVSGRDIYAAVYRRGVYKSTDMGVSWKPFNYVLSHINAQAILVIGDVIFIGTDRGMAKVDAKSTSWTSLGLNDQLLSIYSRNDKLIAGTSKGTAISQDNGDTWDYIRQNGAVHYTHNIGQRIVELGLNGDLHFSDDWGVSWLISVYEPREQSYIYELIEYQDNYIMSNNYGVHHSADKGSSWELIYPTESLAFFDLLVVDGIIYGGTRVWDEYRKRD